MSSTEDDIHVPNADVKISSNNGVWYESKAYKSFLAFISLVRWLIVAAVAAGAVYVYQDRTNTATGMSVTDIAREQRNIKELMEQRKRENDQQLSEIKSAMLPTNVFNARFDDLNKRLDRLEGSLDRMNQRP